MTQTDPATPRVHGRRGVVAVVTALAVLLAALAAPRHGRRGLSARAGTR